MQRHENTIAKLNDQQRAFVEYLHTLESPHVSTMMESGEEVGSGWLKVTDYSMTNDRGEELSDEQVANYEPHELYLHLTVIEKRIVRGRGKYPVEVESLVAAAPFVSSEYKKFLKSK